MSPHPFRFTALSTYDARHLNLAAVLEAIRDYPGQSRSEIGDRMPFSRQTMTNVVQELLDMSFVKEEGRVEGRGRGNPHRGLWIRPEAGYVLGVQIRWNRCIMTLVNLSLEIAASATREIEIEWGDVEGFLSILETQLSEFLAQHTDKDIWSVGLSGPLSIEKPEIGYAIHGQTNHLDNSWFLAPLFRDRLEKALRLPVKVVNNPQAAALAQAAILPRDARFVYVLLGMGLGASFVSGRALSRDIWPHGGELGHVLYRDRSLGSVMSSAALLQTLQIPEANYPPIQKIETALRERPQDFEPWLAESAPILRFLVNFLEAATWPDGVVIGGFLPSVLLQSLVDRALPLPNSVVLPDGDPHRRIPRLSSAMQNEQSIPYGAALNVLTYRQNIELPHLIARRRPSRRTD